MEIDLNHYTIYIRPGATDMRKRGGSLAMLVRSEMGRDPYSGSVFLFCGRDRKRVTAVIWDGNGWLEVSKRLECRGGFSWPRSEAEALEVTAGEVAEMLRGGDPWMRFPSAWTTVAE